MINEVKECDVLINNECVTVVRFGETKIQFPSIRCAKKKIMVLFDGKDYIIVDDNYKKGVSQDVKNDKDSNKNIKKRKTTSSNRRSKKSEV